MDFKKIIIALAVIMMVSVSVSVIAADDSEGNITMGNVTTSDEFKVNENGTIYIPLGNDEARSLVVFVTVTDRDSGKIYVSNERITVPAEDADFVGEVSCKFSSSGTYELKIKCTCDDADFAQGVDYDYAEVHVVDSIWSNVTTYLAIAAIVILIIIAVFLKIRSNPKVKPDTTFTELERQNKSATAPAETPATPSTTQRRKYSGNNEKTAQPKEQPEESAPTFTELEAERTAPKEKKAEKESSEPKKLKYVSSRRK